MFSFVAISSIYIFGALLTANGNLKELNIISFSALIINFTLNFILIPKMQAVGSAYANVVTQFAAAIPQVILALVVFRFRVNYRFVASLIIFIMGVTAFNYFSRLLPMTWYMNFMVMVLASVLLASLLRLLNIQSLIAIFKER
jgi:O-antigen/teichoic acid export membrane protein